MQPHSRLCALAILTLLVGIQPLAAAEPASVEVTLWEKGEKMGITLSQDKVKAGPVEFEVTNDASSRLVHEFLITPWKGSLTTLPYDAKLSQVAEDELPGLEGVEDMKPGLETMVRLVLQPGDYVVFCNEPGHYKMGMVGRFIVTR